MHHDVLFLFDSVLSPALFAAAVFSSLLSAPPPSAGPQHTCGASLASLSCSDLPSGNNKDENEGK